MRRCECLIKINVQTRMQSNDAVGNIFSFIYIYIYVWEVGHLTYQFSHCQIPIAGCQWSNSPGQRNGRKAIKIGVSVKGE